MQQIYAVPYDAEIAYSYAEKYAFKVCSDGYFFEESYPPSYLGAGVPVPSGGYDCAHFVSCCIGSEPHEKGGGLNVPSRTEAYGEPSANLLGNWLLDSGIGTEVFSIEELKKGSFINYDWEGNGSWDHTTIYLGDYKIAAHSESHWNDDWKLGGAAKYRFIYIPGELPPPPLTDWPFLQRDLQNTGYNPDALSLRNPKIKDILTIEGTSAYAQPIVEGKMVYMTTENGLVYRVDMDKKMCLVPFDTGAEEIKLTPALSGNKLYILDSDNVLWCLDKQTGDWIWYFEVDEYFGLPNYYWQTSPQVWQKYICFTIGPYAVFIYDDIEIASKSKNPKIVKLAKMPIQIQQEPPEFVATSVITDDGTFYCFDFACNIIAFKINTAEYLWHWSQFPGPQDPAGLTYLGNPFAIVLAGDTLILKNNWRYDFQDTDPKPGETGFLYAINVKAHNEILWAREIGMTSCPSVYKDGILYSFGLFARQGDEGIDGIIYLSIRSKNWQTDGRKGNLCE
ncbi:MAG: amidase domain-containing protein [bacterium]